MKLKQLTFTFLTVCIAVVFGPKAAVEAASLEVLADGLNNARGINFGPDGDIYVGETGLGGNGRCQPSPSAQFENICAGNSGSVTRVTPDGQQERVLENLESLALENSQEQGAGPQELQFDSLGNAYLLTGNAGNPGNRDLELNALAENIELPPGQSMSAPTLPADQLLGTPTLGHLYQVDLETGDFTDIADLSKYELLNNPDGEDLISNPYDFIISGDTAYVADGGANVVWNVNLDGSGVTATPIPGQTINNPVFPPPVPGSEAGPGSQPDQPPAGQPGLNAIPGVPAAQEAPPDGPPPGQVPDQLDIQSVPTGIAVGPDGALYVGEYSGFPFPEEQARIYRIGADGEPKVYADGFTQITDLTFDENGNLLVLQFADESQWKYNDGSSVLDLPSSLIQLAPDGTRTTLVAAGEGLLSATGVIVGPDDQIYVTNRGVGPGIGQVVRVDDIEAVPEPASTLGVLAFGALGVGSFLKRKQKQLADEIAS